MRILSFSKRNAKELLRDPLTLIFGAIFPILLLLLMHVIQLHAPIPLFELSSLVPAIAVFGLSFFALFAAIMVSKDRETAFLQRLYASPMRASDFISGYILPLLPFTVLQSTLFFAFSLILGLPFTGNIFLVILALIPMSLFYIFFGVLFGCILNSKQVGGICGALITNMAALLSGAWFDLSIIGGGFEAFCKLLPFVHAVNVGRTVLAGGTENLLTGFLVVLAYMLAFSILAIVFFLRQMKNN